MADDVKDIAIYDGNKWQSLSALAAEQVEPELPISSADGTVTLSGTSADFMVTVNPNATGMIGDALGSEGDVMVINSSGTYFLGNEITGAPYNLGMGFNARLGTGQSFPAMSWFSQATVMELDPDDPQAPPIENKKALVSNGQINVELKDGAGNGNKGDVVISARTGPKKNQYDLKEAARFGWDVSFSTNDLERFVIDSSGNCIVNVQLVTPTIVGPATATDASIELGAELLTTNHTPTQPNSIATKEYTDAKAAGSAYDDTAIKADLASEASTRAAEDATLQTNIDAKIWVGTAQEYLNLREILPTTLYCLTD